MACLNCKFTRIKNLEQYNKKSHNTGSILAKDCKVMIKDLIRQCVHLFDEVQQCIASLNPVGVPSASPPGAGHSDLACRTFAPHLHRPSHPTSGHRYQGNLRL